MSINDLTSKIENDALLEKEAVISSAKKKASEIEASGQLEIEDFSRKMAEEIRQTLEENERKVKASAVLEVKMKNQETRKAALEGVFAEATKKVTELSSEDYEKFVFKLVSLIPKDISGDVKALSPKSRLSETERALKNSGFKIEAVAEPSLKAGLKIAGDDFEYDLSIERVARSLKVEKETEMAKILFGQ
ncbi:MAG: V-type ATP synthase subunit E [bacterium]|nr:V-type ATP synthase subunit E [bacterium]